MELMKKMNMRHTGIYVENLELMKRFYCDNFQMEVASHQVETGNYIDTILNVQGMELDIYKLTANHGGMIELIKVRKGQQGKRHRTNIFSLGRMHIALTVDDVELIYKNFKEKGIVFLSNPCISPDNYAKVCFCEDPEGNYLELVEVMRTR